MHKINKNLGEKQKFSQNMCDQELKQVCFKSM